MHSGLGTPTDDVWPGVSSLPDYAVTFPKWIKRPISSLIKNNSLDEHGLDLLEVSRSLSIAVDRSCLSGLTAIIRFAQKMLKYNPAERISAKQALNHPYFDDLDKDGI